MRDSDSAQASPVFYEVREHEQGHECSALTSEGTMRMLARALYAAANGAGDEKAAAKEGDSSSCPEFKQSLRDEVVNLDDDVASARR